VGLVIAVLGIGLVLAGAVHWYLWRRLVRDTTRPGRARRIGTIGLIALVASMITALVGFRALPVAAERVPAWLGFTWLALMFYLLLLLLVLELPRLFAHRRIQALDEDRRLLLTRSVAIVAGLPAVGITSSGARTALTRLRREHAVIPLAKLPRQLDGFRIALVSDIHLGPILGRSHTQRVVDMINGMDADVVAVVGDLVDGTVDELRADVDPLRHLRSKRGAFFVTGNHEYYSGYLPWIDEVRSLGLTVLRNERVEIDGLYLAGVNDASGGQYGDAPDYDRALGDRDPSRPAVLLAHQPVQAHEAARHGVDLQLSGHTHGGQIWPFGYFVRLQQPVIAGLGQVGGMPVYVTRGAGFWGPPVRFLAPPDITLVELRAR
jgi:predicted MPP superfamily phosphohydrolase